MRTKTNDWLNTTTMTVSYGLDVLVDGAWHHVMEDGKPCLYDTKEKRDVKRKEVRKMK